METSLVLRLVGLTSLVVAAILLLAPVTGTWASCGSVLFEDKWDDIKYDYESEKYEPYSFHPEGCFTALKDRRTIAIVVAAVGPIAMYGSSQINKRGDDPRKGGPPQGKRQSGKQDQTSAEGTSAREPTRPKFGGFSHLDIRRSRWGWWPIIALVAVGVIFWANFLRNPLHKCSEEANGILNCEYQILKKADLSGRELHNIKLSRAVLIEADLSDSSLFEASLVDADLSGANLRYANLAEANLSGANLSGANLRYAFLWGANLSGANLSGADLFWTQVSTENPSGGPGPFATDLSGANLSGADLFVTNLSGANLSGADLSQTDLWATTLALARADETTVWPKGFDPVTAGVIFQ